MVSTHKPHSGSMQFWPRKRASRMYARIRSWKNRSKEVKLLGFPGYKVGMTHVFLKDENLNYKIKTIDISVPVTVIECPPIKILSTRYYSNSPYGLKLISEVFSKDLDKNLERKIKRTKKTGKAPEEFDEVRLVVYTQPKISGLGKKTPEIMEIGIGGDDVKAKEEFAKSLSGKEIRLSTIFKEGQLVDVHSVTSGKGFQGTVKRFGVKIRQHKAEKTKRGIGTLGAWTPTKVQYTVAQPGRMGFHLRTDYNKLVLKIGNNPEEINPEGAFLHYGLVKGDYILIKGSVPGPVKRLITITEPSKQPVKFKQKSTKIDYINTKSNQG